ncbi:hypothetical protein BY996DRAFT_4585137, partial [Phakopsora pachyrhizi]
IIGCLIAGCTQALMSRSTYSRTRLVLHLCEVVLPSWKIVLSGKSKLQKKCKFQRNLSIIGNLITTVSIKSLLTQEMENPLVAKYPDFNPEVSSGCKFFKFSQSSKWLYQFPRDLWTQMIKYGAKEYYISEPALISGVNVVVPLFF